ncbi:hypothetical protein C6Y14_32890 [Streptomyces dioscori]|uniref:Uncharacterized protein n=1 Tax=Streptomyces dioscori TaxID=2109333 RepID=A0A2P8PZ27_9ACTN|nr:hypothetical protein C6Y14_32890 [Streptomyces dioscori]
MALRYDTLDGSPTTSDWVLAAVGGVLCFGLAAAMFMALSDPRRSESRERVREAEQDLEEALRGSASAPASSDQEADGSLDTRVNRDLDQRQARLTLSELWVVTHRRLDHYHGIALGQAKRSFLSAQIAMGLGFVLLLGFVTIALNASTVAGSVVAGGLGTVAAALAGYVSRTFIRSQEAAAGHLRAYFDQPLEFSRYLAAERLVTDAGLSEERRAEILSILVQAMISGPSDPMPDGSDIQQSDGRR